MPFQVPTPNCFFAFPAACAAVAGAMLGPFKTFQIDSWVTKHCDPVMATGWHMVLGGALLAAAAAASDGPVLAERLALFNASDAAAMTYVSLLGGAASYGIFFYEATHGSLTALSSLTFLTPMFAAGAGYLVLGEVLTPLQLVGAGVTLGAVLLINSKPAHAGGEEAAVAAASTSSSSSNGNGKSKAS
jgi:drug/metabolite transporter (DMT)-like permease